MNNNETNFEFAKIAVKTLDDKKGSDIQLLKIDKLTVLADYFIIAEGSSSTQIRSLADAVEVKLSEAGLDVTHREGYNSDSWILLDYGAIIVHVFSKETREFYNLERLWADAEKIDISDIITK